MQNSKVRSQNISKCHFWTHFKTFSILQSYGGAKIPRMSTLDILHHIPSIPTLIHIQTHTLPLKITKNHSLWSHPAHEKKWKFSKNTKNPKISNHVFKTSKKTLSYSRTYCKIYKIENIGKIGQSTAGMLAKRVIYYGSTRSTLGTPLSSERPPHFSRWILKSRKNPNYHFWGFLSQKRQKRHFSSILRHHDNLVHARNAKLKSPISKQSQNVTFGPILKLFQFYSHIQELKIPKCHFCT